MRYFFYIDESGSFDEGLKQFIGRNSKRSSLVGGICSSVPSDHWVVIHNESLHKFNASSGADFVYPRHFHCGKLKECAPDFVPPGIERSCAVSFARAVFDAICDHASFVFASKNQANRFEFSRQATYGINLLTAIRVGLETLAAQVPLPSGLDIVVATRTIRETSDIERPGDYAEAMLAFIKAQLVRGTGRGVSLARDLIAAGTLSIKCDSGYSNAGLIAADFVCSFIRENENPPIRFVLANPPEDVLFGDYLSFYKRQIKRLLEGKHYATAAEFLRNNSPTELRPCDLTDLIKSLEKETDPEVLTRELHALVANCDYLIHKRITEANALASARSILECIIRVARQIIQKTEDVRVKQQWADVLVTALVDLSTCYNHVGAVGPQKEIEDELSRILASRAKLLSKSHVERDELLLEAKNKNLNELFNDYRFNEVVESFEKQVTVREKRLPLGASDELLGKMLGSLGQACGFRARIDQTWSGVARDYFERSLEHFEPGTYFYSMSVNFLATLAWQDGNIGLACAEMSRHSHLPPLASPEDFISNFEKYLTHDRINAFDAVNYARILGTLAERLAIDQTRLTCVIDYWQPRLLAQHPYEQLLKWLAYTLYCSGKSYLASELCQKGVNISRNLDFTVQTVGLSLAGLLCFCWAERHDNEKYARTAREFQLWASGLAARSLPFASYLDHFGGQPGLVGMLSEPSSDHAARIARFLPFTYA